jgi:dTDP-4-dehydrorhamnose reductase
MRVAVIGANGQLGTAICAEATAQGHTVLPFTHEDIDMGNALTMGRLVDARPEVVINTAAVHDMARCEQEPDLAWEVNMALPLARLSKICGWYLIYVSTDYVFDGVDGAYNEISACAPLSTYGRTKLAGELAVRTYLPTRGAICRVSTLFGESPCRGKRGSNLVDRIVEMARSGQEGEFDADTIFSPTYAADAAVQIMHAMAALVRGYCAGVFHCVNLGTCSHWEFAQRIGMFTTQDPVWEPRKRFGKCANDRPQKTGLLNTRLPVAPTWVSGLREYLQMKYGKGA